MGFLCSVPPSEQQTLAIWYVLWFCSPDCTKLKDGSLKMQIRTESERITASSVPSRENFQFQTDTVVRRLDWAVREQRMVFKLQPTKNHQVFQIRPLSTSNYCFLSSHHRLILQCCPGPTQSPSFTIVKKRRLYPHLASFLHLFWEGKRQG